MIGIGTPINHSKIPRPMMKLLFEGVSAQRDIGMFVARRNGARPPFTTRFFYLCRTATMRAHLRCIYICILPRDL